MITLRLVVPAVLAAVAGCFNHFVTPQARVQAGPLLSPTMPDLAGPDTRASVSIDQSPNAEEKAAEAYREAAETILRRAPYARASADADAPPIMGPIPLPRRRPITRP
jgi:hypothetical protein